MKLLTQLATLATISFSTQKIKNFFRSREKKSFNHIRILLILQYFQQIRLRFVNENLHHVLRYSRVQYQMFNEHRNYRVCFCERNNCENYMREIEISCNNSFSIKHLNCFNENKVKFIIHVIYSTLTIQNHNELIISMFITKTKSHSIILNKLWMNKHEIILNWKIDNLIFKRERCDHAKALKKFKRDEFSSFSRVFYLSSSFKFQVFISQIDSQKYIIMQNRSIFSISKMIFSKFTIKNALEKKIEIFRDTLNLDAL